jgi:putative SOS response-associated peptidase YedK
MPSTAFYEPATVNGKKYQVRFKLKNGAPLAFAALWQKTEIGDEKLNCCSLLTCEPNSLVGEIHGRMPVILRPEQFETYLPTPPEQAESLPDILQPYPADEMVGRSTANRLS